MRKLTFGTIAVVFLVSLGLAGVGAAQTYENVSSSDMPINETVAPGDDTESIQVIGENITNDTASVTIFELEDGNETQVGTGTLNTTTTTTDTYEYSQINTSLEYRVLVEGDGADLIDVAKVQVVSAGGGGSGDLLSSAGDLSNEQAGIIALVVVALVGLFVGRDYLR